MMWRLARTAPKDIGEELSSTRRKASTLAALLHSVSFLGMLLEVCLTWKRHSAGWALEASSLGRHHVYLPMFHQFALGLELRAAGITLVLLSKKP